MTSISSEDAFAAWAPDGVFWSEWAKPIAFIQSGATIVTEPAADAANAFPGPLDHGSVLIVDLPGAEAVHAGLALAGRGYRPVPVFNGTSGPSAVIDVSPVTRALGSGAERLKGVSLGPDAPPAFLLDSRRNGGGVAPKPGSYDNRWIALPQDFPSGALLASRGFRTATLMLKDSMTIPPDLAHVLRRWQDHGIQIRVADVAKGQGVSNVTVPKPSGFKLAWYAAVALLGLRRSHVGGFGSAVPEEAQRSGFYG